MTNSASLASRDAYGESEGKDGHSAETRTSYSVGRSEGGMAKKTSEKAGNNLREFKVGDRQSKSSHRQDRKCDHVCLSGEHEFHEGEHGQ
jgi:hypothetical protein